MERRKEKDGGGEEEDGTGNEKNCGREKEGRVREVKLKMKIEI